MTKFSSLLIFTFALLFVSERATAQWDLLSDLFNQTDSTTFDGFFDDLGSLDSTWSVNPGQGNDLLDDLTGALNDSLPGITLDSSYLGVLGAGMDSLLLNIPGFGLPGADEDTLFGELGRIDSLLAANFDSLGGVFGQYQDSLTFDSANWDVTIIGFDSLVEEQFNVLQDSLDLSTDGSIPDGPDDLPGLMDKLFSVDLFPDIELAFGVQKVGLKYYDEAYFANAKVIRIGSVPRFDQTSVDCHDGIARFPVEARWHFQASWTNSKGVDADGNEVLIASEEKQDFIPLLFSGDYAVMLTSTLGKWGNTSFRLITSLGTEFGTFAPAHREYAPPFTTGNRGFFTSVGPQAGAGFSMATGPLVISSIGTVAFGKSLKSRVPYDYSSNKFEVGIRYGNVINVRYATGKIFWQEDGNRLADIKNQVTVGIILQGLNH